MQVLHIVNSKMKRSNGLLFYLYTLLVFRVFLLIVMPFFPVGPPETVEQIDRRNALLVDYHHRQVHTAQTFLRKKTLLWYFPIILILVELLNILSIITAD